MAIPNRLVFLKQRQVLRQLGVILGDFGQIRVVHLAQFRAIHHHIEMTNLTPRARQMFIGVFKRLHETAPGWRRGISQ